MREIEDLKKENQALVKQHKEVTDLLLKAHAKQDKYK